MEKPIFIHSDEILLVVYDDDQHIGQSGPLDASQVQAIIDEADDAIQILRVNPSEKSCEDISEEIAEAYVEENIERLNEDSEVHYFIRESDAYNRLLDDLAKEKYNDEVYGTYEQQHRLRPCDVL
ncbi:hypothetical protein [Bartonella henselae]|uniref:Uncharacterized protein n=2 Tax=Bartonella henselae TaxID=38323 RepID=X5M3H2_BARHN|nr:hypothetical protein [Bartonella henselae]ATP12444.1 hypothetical protein BhenCHDE101_04655 [Bartonella henselae]MDM9984109.1 hypothetical protein [Bartonella henselae]MDM9987114.1 hypothetical protein [Bartonella henselae]MDM9991548.1 hypothetical protein [Bartonella henselae]MDM9996005.1 hypothetical protein [Bartonella henselae]